MDYIPTSDSDLSIWLQNYKAQIATAGAAAGLTAPAIAHEQSLCDAMLTKLSDVQTAKNALAGKVTAKNDAKQTVIGELRTIIGTHKTNTAFTQEMKEKLKINGSASALDEATYKTVLTGRTFAGYVRIKFTKNGVDGINIYHRKKGAATWDFLARDTKSPYDDHIVLAVANQPEHWEYRAYGVINDEEIGLPSDIIEIVFGG